jgi:hypothetical protein
MSKINPQPKKLTLEQALNATSTPLKRWGDLIWVSGDPMLVKANIHIGTFMPRRDGKFEPPDQNGNFERNFSQPATENALRELYSTDGWIESAAEFSDEALALHFNYRGGIFRGNPFAGDVGDPSRFVSDCREALDQIYQPEQKDVEVIRKTVLTVHKKDRLAANVGVQHSKQQKGFREDKQKLDVEKHEQWRKWQTAEKASNPQFAKQRKQEQAKRLKNKYSIPEAFGSIAKRLNPLPIRKKK